MPNYLAFDGGGTKIKAIVYDGERNILSYKKSGGINTNFYSSPDILRHIDEAVRGAVEESRICELTSACGILVGNSAPISEYLNNRFPGAKLRLLGEGFGYLLAASLCDTGCVALAGTGSGAVWIRGEDNVVHRGGYGAYIGDEGGGYYIGEHGIRAALSYGDGWGEPTLLYELLCEYLGMPRGASPIPYFYGNTDKIPLHMRISGFTRPVEAACARGDAAAISIVRSAGEAMAGQMCALFKKYGVPADTPVYMCGGAWRTSPFMEERFKEVFFAQFPGAQVRKPFFEPVVAGVVYPLFKAGVLPEFRARLFENFSGV